MPSFQSSGVSAPSDCIVANDASLACAARTRDSRLVIGMAGIIVRASPKPRGVHMRGMNITAGIAVVLGAGLALTASSAQQMPKTPEFEFDPKWPVIPNNWVLGEVTSISVDHRVHIWVLHVPQSIPEAQRANAAPPVLEFDASGKLLSSWGAPSDGSPWPGREHGIFVDDKDFVWIGGRAGWPRATTPGQSDDMIGKYTTDGKFGMQTGRSGHSKANLDTEKVQQATAGCGGTMATAGYTA